MKWLSLLAVGLASAASTGCGPTETAPPPLSCGDPAMGEVDEQCGIWVSASLGDDANPGTQAAPMASLTAAAAVAYEKQRSVYACGELWTEPLILPKNVGLYGGFDCQHDWTYVGQPQRSRVETGPDQIPLKTSGRAGTLLISDFEIYAADATIPGGSSIAVMVTDDNDVTFQRCTILAGDAADGLDGEAIEEAAAAGAAGNPGVDACTTAGGPGGAAVETDCGQGVTSRGGKGGDGGTALATGGEPGTPTPAVEKDPNDPQDGDGGIGQVGAEGCTPGEPGANGADGDGADFVKGLGTLSAEGFTGLNGLDGKDGMPGQGGGGGGGARGAAMVCGAASPGGAGGGSGGSGGCGGKGGRAGQFGGSSFALVLISTGSLLVSDSEIWIGAGGRGGDGAPGQPGGAGGQGGPGGAAQATLQPGCQGGAGGNGGKGGGGGGGNGGHSVHVAFSYGSSYPFSIFPGTTFHGNTVDALGGKGANGAAWGQDGQDSDPITGEIFIQFYQ